MCVTYNKKDNEWRERGTGVYSAGQFVSAMQKASLGVATISLKQDSASSLSFALLLLHLSKNHYDHDP